MDQSVKHDVGSSRECLSLPKDNHDDPIKGDNGCS